MLHGLLRCQQALHLILYMRRSLRNIPSKYVRSYTSKTQRHHLICSFLHMRDALQSSSIHTPRSG